MQRGDVIVGRMVGDTVFGYSYYTKEHGCQYELESFGDGEKIKIVYATPTLMLNTPSHVNEADSYRSVKY